MKKRRPRKPTEPTPDQPMPEAIDNSEQPEPEPPEHHCRYDVVHGLSWDDLVAQVNIECSERGAIPTGGPAVSFTPGGLPYSQAVIYPVERD